MSIFDRPKTPLRVQRKIWKQLHLGLASVQSPLARLAFRQSTSRGAMGTGIVGAAVMLLLISNAEPSPRRSKKVIPAKPPTIKLSTQVPPALPTPKASPTQKAPPAPKAPPTQKAPPAPKAPPKPRSIPQKKVAQDKRPTAASKPTKQVQTLDFSGQSAGSIQSSNGAAPGSSSGLSSGPGPRGPGASGTRQVRRGGGRNLSQRAKVSAGAPWNCTWPDAAVDRASNQERVLLEISIDARGNMSGGKVLSSPGFGFGQEALNCASHQRYTPAKNHKGQAISGGKIKVRVNFQRSE